MRRVIRLAHGESVRWRTRRIRVAAATGSVNCSQLSVTREIGVNDLDQAWCRGNLRGHNGMHSQL